MLAPCLAAAALLNSQAQAPSPGPRAVIVLDPAHGGQDGGAPLGDQLMEKDVTLAVASRLRQALAASGFAVVSTRDSDLQNPLTTDQRAELANRQHALACLVIHATETGSGVHLYASPLPPSEPPINATGDPDYKPPFQPTPWDEAQAASVAQSLRLQNELNGAFGAAKIPALRARASIRPLDNLTCPAIAIEIAPLGASDSDRTPVTDAGYQQRLADTVAAALRSWRTNAATASGGAQ